MLIQNFYFITLASARGYAGTLSFSSSAVLTDFLYLKNSNSQCSEHSSPMVSARTLIILPSLQFIRVLCFVASE